MKIKGGHALMLTVSVPDALLNHARRWCGRQSSRVMKVEHHITLAHFGRNKDESVGRKMRAVGEELCNWVSKAGYVTPESYQMFGYRKDHLALVLPKYGRGFHPRWAMDQLDILLEAAHLKRDTRFSFNPHVTLAVQNDPGSCLPCAVLGEDMNHEITVTGIEVKIGSHERQYYLFDN